MLYLVAEATIDVAIDCRQNPYCNKHKGCNPERTVTDTKMRNQSHQFCQQIDDMRQQRKQHTNDGYSEK